MIVPIFYKIKFYVSHRVFEVIFSHVVIVRSAERFWTPSPFKYPLGTKKGSQERAIETSIINHPTKQKMVKASMLFIKLQLVLVLPLGQRTYAVNRKALDLAVRQTIPQHLYLEVHPCVEPCLQ